MKEFEATLENEECTVNVTIDSKVTLNKLYGPLCFCNIRVRLDYNKCQWIVEKEVDTYDDTDNFAKCYRLQCCNNSEWVEVARIDGQ